MADEIFFMLTAFWGCASSVSAEAEEFVALRTVVRGSISVFLKFINDSCYFARAGMFFMVMREGGLITANGRETLRK